MITNSETTSNTLNIVPYRWIYKMELLSIFTDRCCQNSLKVLFIIETAAITGEQPQKAGTTKKEATIAHPFLDAHPNRAEIRSISFS